MEMITLTRSHYCGKEISQLARKKLNFKWNSKSEQETIVQIFSLRKLRHIKENQLVKNKQKTCSSAQPVFGVECFVPGHHRYVEVTRISEVI